MFVVIPTKDILVNRIVSNKKSSYVPQTEEVLKYLDNLIDYIFEISVSEGPQLDPELLDSYLIELYFNWAEYDPCLLEPTMYDQFFEIFSKLYKRINKHLTTIPVSQEEMFNPRYHTLGPYQFICYDIAVNVEIKKKKTHE